MQWGNLCHVTLTLRFFWSVYLFKLTFCRQNWDHIIWSNKITWNLNHWRDDQHIDKSTWLFSGSKLTCLCSDIRSCTLLIAICTEVYHCSHNLMLLFYFIFVEFQKAVYTPSRKGVALRKLQAATQALTLHHRHGGAQAVLRETTDSTEPSQVSTLI